MTSSSTGIVGWYNKVAAFNVESLFSRRRKAGPPRTVYVHEQLPEDYYDHKGRVKKEHIYPSNQVITSKYTVVTFLPRNLLEQFRRIANIFFLAIAILQFFPQFSTISPGLVLLPLLIVLAISAIKDGYEDVKRHQSDRKVNHGHVRVLSADDWDNPNAMAQKEKTFVRGIVAKPASAMRRRAARKAKEREEAERGEKHHEEDPPFDPDNEYDDISMAPTSPVPTSPTHERHQRRTSSIFRRHEKHDRPHWRRTLWEDVRVGDFVKIADNEQIPADVLICATSEEENVAFVETKNLDGETNLKSRSAVSTLTHLRTAADCANKDHSFRVNCDIADSNMYRINAAVVIDGNKSPVDLQNVLLRGTMLRNTKWVIGVVLFSGIDTKIVLNSGGTPSKRSKVERQMNPQVFINLIILAMMAIACAIADSILETQFYPGAPWLYDDNRSNDNPHINGLITWAYLVYHQN